MNHSFTIAQVLLRVSCQILLATVIAFSLAAEIQSQETDFEEIEFQLKEKLERLKSQTDLISKSLEGIEFGSNSRPRLLNELGKSLETETLSPHPTEKMIRERLFQIRRNLRNPIVKSANTKSKQPIVKNGKQKKTAKQNPVEKPDKRAASKPDSAESSGSLAQKIDAAALPIFSEVEPVDKVSLANNLFLLEKMDAAIRLYQELKPKVRDPYKRAWIDYQISSCVRVKGDSEKAKALYRELLLSSPDRRINEMARWWINHLGRRIKLEAALADIENQMQKRNSNLEHAGG